MKIFNPNETIEWEIISDFYGDKTAARSKVPLINHIKEGLIILDKIDASTCAKRAFMIHPLIQSNFYLKHNFDDLLTKLDIKVISLALEYRNIANQFLSDKLDFILEHDLLCVSAIQSSPLKDVNDMLIADKVQNKKDFMLHLDGRDDVTNSHILKLYFNMWLDVLQISELKYNELVKHIS